MAHKEIPKTGYYPTVGFHFKVHFDGFSKSGYDIQFQSVSGLQAQIETESVKEGGVNSHEHVLPTRRKYSDLTLKRGIVIEKKSEIMEWCQDALNVDDGGHSVTPKNLQVTLLNDEHKPLMVWNLIHAWPKSWKFSDLNADKGEIMIETLELTYNRFTVEKIKNKKK